MWNSVGLCFEDDGWIYGPIFRMRSCIIDLLPTKIMNNWDMNAKGPVPMWEFHSNVDQLSGPKPRGIHHHVQTTGIYIYIVLHKLRHWYHNYHNHPFICGGAQNNTLHTFSPLKLGFNPHRLTPKTNSDRMEPNWAGPWHPVSPSPKWRAPVWHMAAFHWQWPGNWSVQCQQPFFVGISLLQKKNAIFFCCNAAARILKLEMAVVHFWCSNWCWWDQLAYGLAMWRSEVVEVSVTFQTSQTLLGGGEIQVQLSKVVTLVDIPSGLILPCCFLRAPKQKPPHFFGPTVGNVSNVGSPVDVCLTGGGTGCLWLLLCRPLVWREKLLFLGELYSWPYQPRNMRPYETFGAAFCSDPFDCLVMLEPFGSSMILTHIEILAKQCKTFNDAVFQEKRLSSPSVFPIPFDSLAITFHVRELTIAMPLDCWCSSCSEKIAVCWGLRLFFVGLHSCESLDEGFHLLLNQNLAERSPAPVWMVYCFKMSFLVLGFGCFWCDHPDPDRLFQAVFW